jgi:hypothetical protein
MKRKIRFSIYFEKLLNLKEDKENDEKVKFEIKTGNSIKQTVRIIIINNK